jgi:hypothetical protein
MRGTRKVLKLGKNPLRDEEDIATALGGRFERIELTSPVAMYLRFQVPEIDRFITNLKGHWMDIWEVDEEDDVARGKWGYLEQGVISAFAVSMLTGEPCVPVFDTDAISYFHDKDFDRKLWLTHDLLKYVAYTVGYMSDGLLDVFQDRGVDVLQLIIPPETHTEQVIAREVHGQAQFAKGVKPEVIEEIAKVQFPERAVKVLENTEKVGPGMVANLKNPFLWGLPCTGKTYWTKTHPIAVSPTGVWKIDAGPWRDKYLSGMKENEILRELFDTKLLRKPQSGETGKSDRLEPLKDDG